ncbi:5,10-methylenetetrahydrofolate reductase [Fundidesulfovibrio magnetotacticus]|uniref:Methylenetetrahydrofolate reductase n=1 Tax=Fundidesulfovibrio magnetotacticus TaxID=2730080 RepID=A0A6V8LLM0_9BACT|nr:methylenetetrahydrofolate reductase [NAD(P)H] [Fundidesulfovibrio magnetotacticus]GFK92604.1 5,10-methylenetetrahydrofolate reductase [Fundidesulfovibrio magnetotacticus]
MRIDDLLSRGKQFISLEFFPPKEKDAWPAFFYEAGRLSVLKPLFVSVTYGAGGSTQANTLELVTRFSRDLGQNPMAHLTCVGASEESLRSFMDALKAAGVDNVLALRGDPPQNQPDFTLEGQAFQHGSDLAGFIRQAYPDLCIGVAGYPEKHPQAESLDADIDFLKLKIEKGGNFVITQLFFDNDHYFRFVERCRARGIDAPVIPGVLPILNLASIKRILSMCGATLPPDYLARLEAANASGGAEAVRAEGVAYARAQCRDLLERGAPGVHLYTLNKAQACLDIAGDLKLG